MAQQNRGDAATAGLRESAGSRDAFNGGELWIGRHSADQDVLVFDPEEADAYADPISFYSLDQHRKRSFPRAIVAQKIHPLTDDVGMARAKKDYARRDEFEAAQQEAAVTERAERAERQRKGVIEAHQLYLAAIGVPYGGVREASPDRRHGRRTRCRTCGISLDNFAGAACEVCDGLLCSCGACACERPAPAE